MSKEKISIWQSLDRITVLFYVALMALGWISVCGACYDFDTGGSIFDFASRSGKQLIWIASALILAVVVLSIDEHIVESLSYILYIGMMAVLLVTPFLAHDTKGSLSWIDLGGGVKLQPAEFAKFATALCVAKLIDGYKMNLSKWPKLLMAATVFVIPMGLIVMQKETGSALVYLAFFLMCYREGMSGSVLFAGVAAVTYFVVGARYAEVPFWGVLQTSTGQFMVLSLIHVFTSLLLWVYGEYRSDSFRLFFSGLLVIVCAILFSRYVVPFNASWVVLLVLVADIVYLILLSFKDQILRYFYIALFTLISTGFYYSVDYVLSDVLRPHQQTRVKVLLGLEDDPRGAGYNVIQAQIAIGSGGLRGKGFLRGTQTKLKYVPEQDTDFIFCTVGEEEGFLGCSAVLLLFLALILRLIVLAEQQYYTFGRVYGYCVLSIFLFHLFINVGMVLGLTPVIGIPLPFFSYGGSSLWGFTLLLFIFLRMDAGRRRSEHK